MGYLKNRVVRRLCGRFVMLASILAIIALVSARTNAQYGQGEDSAAAAATFRQSAAELGVVTTPSPGKGVHVAETVWRGPASRAGVRRGDYIMSVDGEDVSQPSELREVIQKKEVGSTVQIVIWRRGVEISVDVVLAGSVQPPPPVQQGWLGIELEESDGQRVTIRQVQPSSPADVGGLQPGDTIRRFGDQQVTSVAQLIRLIRQTSPHSSIELTIGRGDKELVLKVVTDSRLNAPWGWRHQVFRRFVDELPLKPERLSALEEYEGRLRNRVDDLQQMFEQLTEDVDFLRQELRQLTTDSEEDNQTTTPQVVPGNESIELAE